MSTEAGSQAENVTPPELGAIVAITLDTTSRAYDLSGISLGGKSFAHGGSFYLKLLSETADCYYAFSSATGTIDNTAAMAAGGAVAFTSAACDRLVKDVPEHVRVDRVQHRWLIVKGAAAGILRLRASSHPV